MKRTNIRFTRAAAVALALGAVLAGAPAVTQAGPPAASARALTGTWSFTTISGTTYWDKSTGAYLGDGTGGSQSYTFSPNGTYKLFNYVKSGSYGWEMKALTWENGRYRVSGDRLILTPASGKYQVMDNRVKKNNYTRPMRADELKKNAKALFWRVEQDENGKSVLRMGKDPDSQSSYQRAK